MISTKMKFLLFFIFHFIAVSAIGHIARAQSKASLYHGPTKDLIIEPQRGKLLGSGSNKTVFEATWGEQRCAMYEYPHNAKANFTALHNEIEIMRLFQNAEGVVQLLDYGITQEKTTVVLQLYPEGALSQFIDEEKSDDEKKKNRDSLNFPLAYEVSKQVCNAIVTLHSRGYTHQDIKPANILIKSYNPTLNQIEVALSDFDLAFHHSSVAPRHGGTLLYAQPKYLIKEVDPVKFGHQNDYWGFAMTILNLIHGHHNDWQSVPFERFWDNLTHLRQSEPDRYLQNSINVLNKKYPTENKKIDKLAQLLKCSLKVNLSDSLNCDWNQLCRNLSSDEMPSDETKADSTRAPPPPPQAH